MDTQTYKYYLIDNISIIKDKIFEILSSENIDDFISGKLMAYYDIITIFKEQSIAFNIDYREIGLEIIDENEILSKIINQKNV